MPKSSSLTTSGRIVCDISSILVNLMYGRRSAGIFSPGAKVFLKSSNFLATSSVFSTFSAISSLRLVSSTASFNFLISLSLKAYPASGGATQLSKEARSD